MDKNLSAFIGCESGYAQADTVLFGAPFDGTTSFRPGARFGPDAMRRESEGLETYSPYLDRDLAGCAVFDAGDLALPFGNPARVLEEIEAFAGRVLDDGKRPVMLGGEHLVTLGAVRAAARRCPGLHILHLDAHADLREEYMGETLSHATVLRRCWELVGDGRIHQFGVRSGTREEFQWAKDHVAQRKFDCAGFAETALLLRDAPVYLTIDLDVLDPSIFPGTGTPEAGGITFDELLRCIGRLQGLDVRGADLCELSPHYDPSGVSTAVACKALRELLLTLCEG